MATSVVDLSKYDNTARMAPFFDPHFLLPILRWLRESNIYPDVQIRAAEFDLLGSDPSRAHVSRMADFTKEAHQNLVAALNAAGRADEVKGLKLPSELLDKEVLQEEFAARMDAGKGAWAVIGDKDKVTALRAEGKFNYEGLLEQGATPDEISSIFDLARFYHSCGLYKQALEAVVLYRKVGAQDGGHHYFGTMWAQLAECICMLLNPTSPSAKRPLSSVGGDEPSDYALRVLRDTIEKRTTLEGVKEVEQRRWMLHWALFVIFSRSNAEEELFDLFFAQREAAARSEQRTRKNDYLAIAQTVSPWLLRYVGYSAVLNFKNIGKRLRQFVKVLKVEEQHDNGYSGPMTRFFVALFDECDIQGALKAVQEGAHVIRGDFFLGHLAAGVKGSIDTVVKDFQHAALQIVFHEILKLYEEVPFEKARTTYFSEFPSITTRDLRVWVADFDQRNSSHSHHNNNNNNNNNSTPQIDETKESVSCHQLFNIKVSTIHDRITEQTKELMKTADKLRNRYSDDRAFERDMGGKGHSGGMSRGTGGTSYSNSSHHHKGNRSHNNNNGNSGGSHKNSELSVDNPFTNAMNSRDPRNKSHSNNNSSNNNKNNNNQPKREPPRVQNSRWQQKESAPAAAPAPAPAAAANSPRSGESDSWGRAPKPATTADSSSWR